MYNVYAKIPISRVHKYPLQISNRKCWIPTLFLRILIFSITFIYSVLPISTLQQSDQSYIHTHICIFFSNFILHCVPSQVTRIYFSVPYSRISLVVHSKRNILHLLTLDSQSISLPPPPPPPWQPQLCSSNPWVSFLWKNSFVPYIRFQI